LSDTVPVTFRYALGQRVRWALEPDGRWRVIARLYEQSLLRSGVRYQLRAMDETQDVVVYEDDLAPVEDE
jgi:hypothetical protein